MPATDEYARTRPSNPEVYARRQALNGNNNSSSSAHFSASTTATSGSRGQQSRASGSGAALQYAGGRASYQPQSASMNAGATAFGRSAPGATDRSASAGSSSNNRRLADNEIVKVEIPRWKSKQVEFGRPHHGLLSSLSPMMAAASGTRSTSWNGKEPAEARLSTNSAGTTGNASSADPGSSGGSGDGKRYTVFQVYVQYQNGRVLMLEKRYSHFRELHKLLRHKYAAVSKMYFPPKKFFMSLSLHVIEQRRAGIEAYVNAVLSLRPRPVELAQFLSGGLGQSDNDDDPEPDLFLDISHLRSSHLAAPATTGTATAAMTTAPAPVAPVAAPSAALITMADFDILKMLGKGSFGKVYLVKRKASGEIMAMKVLRKTELVKRSQVNHTMTERRIMSSVNHPFIVGLRYAFQTHSKLVMLSDYCCGGEIFFHLKKFRSFSEAMVRFYAAELIMKSPLKFPSHFGLSPEVKSIIAGLLERDPTYRLGCRPGAGVQDIKNHAFFAEIDWELLESRGVKPPFKPRVRGPTDIQNFDREFTKETPDHQFLQQDKRLIVSPKNEFNGFSYTPRTTTTTTSSKGRLPASTDPRLSTDSYESSSVRRNFSLS
ncbi:hypothetical protein PybrP1_011704 [[Pythium] brassicae (nom. inval.)]|nr:hypothetical protein PybrP1_011704 [[Pythium] brassicae (nom. inval.)]